MGIRPSPSIRLTPFRLQFRNEQSEGLLIIIVDSISLVRAAEVLALKTGLAEPSAWHMCIVYNEATVLKGAPPVGPMLGRDRG